MLDETDYLDLSYPGFHLGFRSEIALVALIDDFYWKKDREGLALLNLMGLSNFSHGIFLDGSPKAGVLLFLAKVTEGSAGV